MPSTEVMTFERITLRLLTTWWIGEVNSSPISWSFRVLVGALCLVWTLSVCEVGLVPFDDYLLQLPCLLPFLWEWVVDWVADVSVGPHVTLSLYFGGVLARSLSLQIGIMVTVQVQAKCPNRWHFRHWFGRPEYRILCTVVFFAIAPSAMEGIQMYLASLSMSQVSTMIMGQVGLFMYESSNYISGTSPILLTMIVKAFVILNY